MNDRPTRTPAALAETIATTCGPHRTLHVGAGDGALVGELLAHGSDAFGNTIDPRTVAAADAHWPGRFTAAPIDTVDPGSCTTVVATMWLDGVADDRVPEVLEQLCRISSRFVFLVVRSTPVRTRAWWESRCLAAGLRKHPAYYSVNTYAALEHDGVQLLLPFERVPAAAVARYPLAVLERTRQLHMDMLRETGRRGDAHCVRYHIAAQHVRPGDAVLDLACGYGYGSHILWQNSLAASVLGIDLEVDVIEYATANYAVDGAVRFARGNAQQLGGIADHSIDFVASFETIEHLPDPAAYLDELKRVLKPSGRVMVCAPNEWVDETGKDPNPWHLHVYTWERLRTEIGARFVLEKGFVQTAGGAMKHHHAPRAWWEVPLAPLTRDAEWILVLAMADPHTATTAPYVETSWPLPASPDFNFLAFARDYRNPWLGKGMVTIGMRLEEPAALAAVRTRTLRDAPKDSVDHGAALCGEAYAELGKPRPDAAAHEALQHAIDAYAALPAGGAHRLRWQISLLFVGGELARRRGDWALARRRYRDCAARDPCSFSPLLGNRTLDALFRLAAMDVAARDLGAARSLLQRAVGEARRMVSGSWVNVCGDADRPIPAGLAELAQLLDKAGRAAYALAVLDTAVTRPGAFTREAKGWFERILDFKNDDIDDLRRGNQAMRDDVMRLNERVARLEGELAAKEQQRVAPNASPEPRATPALVDELAVWDWRRWLGLLKGGRV